MNQTHKSFNNKWTFNKDLAFLETMTPGSDIQNWIIERNGFLSLSEFSLWLKGRKRILDAGCGNGRVTSLIASNVENDCQIVGIDFTDLHAAAENLKKFNNIELNQKDILGDLSDIGYFDLIYCQEVLHHTADPKAGFLNLTKCLNSEGEIAIYVYREKAPIREFVDDYIRNIISPFEYDDAIKSMHEIAMFGKTLSELSIEIEVPNVKILGIEAGKYDLQRFIYHYFFKCFWNSKMDLQSNIAINYDWYHPNLCTRHNLKEVRQWFDDAGLQILHSNVDQYGITIRGKKI